MQFTIGKKYLQDLLYEYRFTYEKPASITLSSKEDKVTLVLNGKRFEGISREDAANILESRVRSKKEAKLQEQWRRNKKGKGYIGRSMSRNAEDAYRRGLKPISKFSAAELKENGFRYSLAFFKWLTQQYINCEETHHTTASKRMTKFYGKQTIRKLVNSYDLELLYRLYRYGLSQADGFRMKGLQYVRIQALDSLIGGTSGCTVRVDCIQYDAFLFYSFDRCFYKEDRRLCVMEVYIEQKPDDWQNKNTTALEVYLLTYTYAAIMRRAKRTQV